MRLGVMALAAALTLPTLAPAANTTQPANTNNTNRNTNNRNTNTNNQNRNNNRNNTRTQNTAPTPTPATPARPIGTDTAANQEIASDKAALDQASTAYNGLIDRLTKEFEATTDMAAALAAMQEASAKLESIKPPLIEKAKASAAYVKISGDLDKYTAQIAKLHEEGAADSEIKTAADKLSECDAAQNKVIADTLAANQEYVITQARYESAQSKARILRGAFITSLEGNKEVVDAKAAVSSAKATLDDAKKRLSMTSMP